jgi:nucleotide-binding universal stress UspA family protein
MENYSTAVSDFRRARSRAGLQSILDKLTGGNSELLSYEDVRRIVRATGVVSRAVRDVPLDAIIGSVGRYQDFTRTFLPKKDSDQNRWVRVKIATSGLTGLPPVELYQIGEAYFVVDGHHRISVARQMGQTDIQANVTEVRSVVPLELDSSPDDLLLKAEEAEFLARTGFNELYHDVELQVTCPGRYHELIEHIDVHRYYMGLEQQREIPYSEAAAHWYEHVYLPIVEIINEQGILFDFPGRTEADLYLWIGRHKADLEEYLGWEVPAGPAAADFASTEGSSGGSIFTRIGHRVLDVVVPDELEGAPATGQWRRERMALEDRLFVDILVGLSGQESSWLALEQAITVAGHENSRISGLYVVPNEDERESQQAVEIRDRFFWRCGEVGVECRFAVDVGPVARTLCGRARWSDLLAVNLQHRPGESPRSRWMSGFRTLLQRCSRPILAVPEEISEMKAPLLIHDGSPQSDEALYVATYLSGHWANPLKILLVENAGQDGSSLDEVKTYVANHSIDATFITETSSDADVVLPLAAELGSDILIIGAILSNPVIGAVTGNAATAFLNITNIPIFMCR